jgi:D-glycero-D-manno-heptose 1,7-bisphosphate phosphatase
VNAPASGRPAVFLDRDGVVLRLVPYLARPEDVRLLPGAAEGLARLEAAGFARVVVTNQSVVARGRLSLDGLEAIHARMRARRCSCRKPEPGLILRARDELGLDLQRSYLVGDRWEDLEAARRVAVRGILVRSGYGAGELQWSAKRDGPREFDVERLRGAAVVCDDLGDAVGWILEDSRAT